MKLLLRMRHGLGDNAQFTIVLRHIRHYFPEMEIDVEVGVGKSSYFKLLADRIFERKVKKANAAKYDQCIDVDWPVPKACSGQVPSTKPTRFLQDVLNVEPIESLYKYDIAIEPSEHEAAENYVRTLPDRPFVLFHYISKTLKYRKCMKEKHAEMVCQQIIDHGHTPVILDWKNESTLPDQKTIFNPGPDNSIWGKMASAGTIAALIQRAKLYIGVDSGPLHIAATTQTSSLGVWVTHHPVNFFDLADNVTHLIPASNKENRHIRGMYKDKARRYFEKSYNHFYYKKLTNALDNFISRTLT
jgi:ADP-heptose:LPS heptosyltransferase